MWCGWWLHFPPLHSGQSVGNAGPVGLIAGSSFKLPVAGYLSIISPCYTPPISSHHPSLPFLPLPSPALFSLSFPYPSLPYSTLPFLTLPSPSLSFPTLPYPPLPTSWYILNIFQVSHRSVLVEPHSGQKLWTISKMPQQCLRDMELAAVKGKATFHQRQPGGDQKVQEISEKWSGQESDAEVLGCGPWWNPGMGRRICSQNRAGEIDIRGHEVRRQAVGQAWSSGDT